MRRRVGTCTVAARAGAVKADPVKVAAVKAGAKAVTAVKAGAKAAALSVSAPTVFVTRARADWRE